MPLNSRAPLRLLLATLLPLFAPALHAQAVPPASSPTAATPTPAEIAAAKKKQQQDDEAIMLNVFQVSADASDTYEATNTNSVTGTNTALNKTPLDAKVFNRQIMDDFNVVDMTEMLSKIGGLGPAVINANEDVRGTLEGDRQDPKSMSMRGLAINNPRRDGFLRSDTTLLDSFDIERVEAIGGSNSLLFGSGDAGGVITSTSKRAYLNRRPTATFSATADSEGSRRFTIDAQAGSKYFALRVNAVKGDTRNFRPGLRQQNLGYHLSATIQPWKRLQIRGEYRYFTRDTIFAQAVIVRAPTSLRLNNGALVDNQNSRYLVAFPETQQLLNGVFDLTKVDSAIGPLHRDAYFNHIKSVVAEAALAEGLALQLRYGQDDRVNDALRASSTTLYAPGATGNAYVDPATGRAGTAWAMNQSMVATPYWTGARGYRATLAYQKDAGKWGRHQASLFHSDMDSWTNQQPWRFYETDASGNIIQNLANITNAESGRIVMPATWIAPFPSQILGGKDWRVSTVTLPNGKTYKYAPQIYSGAVPTTANNPTGLSGPITPANTTSATLLPGQSSVTSYFMDDTRETSSGVSLFSEWWKGRIDTMAGYRREEAEGFRNHYGTTRGPLNYDSLTTGAVVDTPIRGLRVLANYATNAKINFDTTRDIYNQPLPAGKGVSKDVGLKFDLFDARISGSFTYYQSEAQNFTANVPNSADVDPTGINGRNGGNAYTYSKDSSGFSVTLSTRPLKGWEVRFNFTSADGAERSDVIVPQFYNDQFNTTTLNGQSVVGIKLTPTSAVTPFFVPETPGDANSAQIPLTVAMLRDRASPYYAELDPESGYITNAQRILMNTPGVGTDVTGLPITQHQLGFVSPTNGTIIVRLAGEQTAGYAERAYSVVNNYRFFTGRLRGLSVGLITSYQQNYRAYMYNDAADANRRKMFYFPDRLMNDGFLAYSFSLSKNFRPTIRLNVSNLFDTNRVLYLKNSANGTLRYAQWFNAPRKFALTTTLKF